MDRRFDQNYLAELQSRVPETEAHFLRTFSRPLWLKLRAKFHSTELVEEACQEALLRIFTYFRSGKTLEFPERLPGFVHAVAANVAMELLRADQRHDPIPEGCPDPPDHVTPEVRAVTEERKRMVQRVLAGLPEQDREILRLVFLEEEDRDEICRRLGVERSYLRVLLHRAKQRFRELLDESEPRPGTPERHVETKALGNAL